VVSHSPIPKSSHQQVLGQRSQKLNSFTHRHIGPNADDIQQMLDALGISTLETLIDQTVPQSIRLNQALQHKLSMQHWRS
jgi:glycine dehydrogenase